MRFVHSPPPVQDEIRQAVSAGAVRRAYPGFAARNKHVAKSELVVALTWGAHGEPPRGSGTGQTWRMCRGTKRHVNLATLCGGAKRARSEDSDADEPQSQRTK